MATCVPDSGDESKKRKLSEEAATESNGVLSSSTPPTFSGFKVKTVLNEISQRKVIFLQGSFPDKEGDAVVILEKTPFSLDAASCMLSGVSRTKADLQNDIYNTLELFPPAEINGIKTTLIHPATEKHIAKYRSQEMFLVEETVDDYKNITLPHIMAEKFSIQWVYNILEKKSEAERIVYENADPDSGFVLLPDMKWDGRQVEDLYLVAIVHRRDIKSLRDLTADHLPLLTSIHTNGKASIKDRYGLSGGKLRVYLHYQPSYYHLHVHFTHLAYDAPGSGCERGHLLSDVISNITIDSMYYQKATMSYLLKAGDPLYNKFQDANRV